MPLRLVVPDQCGVNAAVRDVVSLQLGSHDSALKAARMLSPQQAEDDASLRYLQQLVNDLMTLAGVRGKPSASPLMLHLARLPKAAGSTAGHAAVTWTTMCVLATILEQMDLTVPFRCVEMPLTPCLAAVEDCGVAIDTSALLEAKRAVGDRLHYIEDVRLLCLVLIVASRSACGVDVLHVACLPLSAPAMQRPCVAPRRPEAAR
jgi:DNA polymerase I-like protein with 3'-5' exonuclease and polymerase domains